METTEMNLVPMYEPTALELRAEKEKELYALRDEATPLLSLEITSKKDREKIHDMETKLKAVRLEIEKGRKAFTEEMQKQVKEAQAIEKNLISIISVEDDLNAKKKAYDAEIKRKEEEEEAKRQEVILDRARRLAEYGFRYEPLKHAPSIMSDLVFEWLLINMKEEWERVNQERIDREEREKQERFHLQAEQEKLQQEREALEAEKKRIEDEKRSIEQSRIDQEREAQRQKDIAEAAERARLKAIEDMNLEKERQALKEKEEQEALEKKKKYQTFLATHGISDENKNDFYLLKTDTKIIAYKKLWEFTF